MQKWQHNLRLGACAATVVCMLVGFAGMYNHLRAVFSDPLEDMSHGWLVPIFSLYVLWTQRAELKKAVGAPSVWGFLACLPCIGVALIGSRGVQVRLEQVGFIGLCMAVPWAFYGRHVAKSCVFPALFLLFSVPMASNLDIVTVHLRLFASGTAFVMLRGFGVDVMQVGTAIVSQGAHPFSIDVAEPCSGLRSLVTMTALAAPYAFFTLKSNGKRLVLFALSVPLAMLANALRIFTLGVVAEWIGMKLAMQLYHDLSGYIVFVLSILLLVAAGSLVDRNWRALLCKLASKKRSRA